MEPLHSIVEVDVDTLRRAFESGGEISEMQASFTEDRCMVRVEMRSPNDSAILLGIVSHGVMWTGAVSNRVVTLRQGQASEIVLWIQMVSFAMPDAGNGVGLQPESLTDEVRVAATFVGVPGTSNSTDSQSPAEYHRVLESRWKLSADGIDVMIGLSQDDEPKFKRRSYLEFGMEIADAIEFVLDAPIDGLMIDAAGL